MPANPLPGAALDLPTYRRPAGVHPPLDSPGYRSTALRHPREPLVRLPHGLTEITGPVLGEGRVTAADADLTTQHAGEPLGERIIVTGRVLDSDGRPVPSAWPGGGRLRAGGGLVTLPLTPSQTAGPFFAIGLPWADGPYVVPEGTPGAITISGRVLDGADAPVTDGLVETWQAGPDGRFAHPDDPRSGGEAAEFRGFGRCPTDAAGRYCVMTLRPGRLPSAGGGWEAPHLDVSVFARGLLDRVVTRIYFPDEEEANLADPVLRAIADPGRRATLIAAAQPGQPGEFRFDIRLQGRQETVFFEV